MHEENKIIWQKWYDPLGQDDLEYPDHDISDAMEPEYYEDDSMVSDEVEQPEFYTSPTKVIMTPMGIIPYNENTASNKIFNFWLAHTNFDIDAAICSIIEQQKGVETLDIFTRYRFRIGIGKLFDAKTVMLEINHKLYSFLQEIE